MVVAIQFNGVILHMRLKKDFYIKTKIKNEPKKEKVFYFMIIVELILVVLQPGL